MAVKLNRGSSISDINVTPLVDVMLVLLVIFMVTAPLLETQNQAVGVDLPQVQAAKANVAEDAVVITLDKKRDMYINDNPLAASELKEKLTVLFKDRKRKEIFLRADRAVPYGEVVRSLSSFARGGISRLNMVTDPLESSRGGRAQTLRSQ